MENPMTNKEKYADFVVFFFKQRYGLFMNIEAQEYVRNTILTMIENLNKRKFTEESSSK